MSQTPIRLRSMFQTLWLETYVSDPYDWRPMSQTPMAGDLCLRQSYTYRVVN
jgi:hypothetical protein